MLAFSLPVAARIVHARVVGVLQWRNRSRESLLDRRAQAHADDVRAVVGRVDTGRSEIAQKYIEPALLATFRGMMLQPPADAARRPRRCWHGRGDAGAARCRGRRRRCCRRGCCRCRRSRSRSPGAGRDGSASTPRVDDRDDHAAAAVALARPRPPGRWRRSRRCRRWWAGCGRKCRPSPGQATGPCCCGPSGSGTGDRSGSPPGRRASPGFTVSTLASTA